MKLHKSDTYHHMASIRKLQSVNETWVTMTTSLAALHGIGLAGISNVPQPHIVMQHSAMQKQEPPKSFNLLWSLRPSLLALQIRWMWSRCTVDRFSLSLSDVFLSSLFFWFATESASAWGADATRWRSATYYLQRTHCAGCRAKTLGTGRPSRSLSRQGTLAWMKDLKDTCVGGAPEHFGSCFQHAYCMSAQSAASTCIFLSKYLMKHSCATSQLQECWWFTSRFAAIGFTRAFLQRCSYGPLWTHSRASCGFSRPGIGSVRWLMWFLWVFKNSSVFHWIFYCILSDTFSNHAACPFTTRYSNSSNS